MVTFIILFLIELWSQPPGWTGPQPIRFWSFDTLDGVIRMVGTQPNDFSNAQISGQVRNTFKYRLGTVNSNTNNSKFHLIRIFCEVSVNIFSIISC